MAHFARVESGIVQQVIVVNNETIGDLPFPESEPVGQEFIASLNLAGTWLECSYHANFRGVFPGTGFTWDGTNFVAPDSEVAE